MYLLVVGPHSRWSKRPSLRKSRSAPGNGRRSAQKDLNVKAIGNRNAQGSQKEQVYPHRNLNVAEYETLQLWSEWRCHLVNVSAVSSGAQEVKKSAKEA